jgi:restriction endonuclease S subunit
MIASTGFFVVNQTKNNLVYLAALLKIEIYQNMMIRETAGGIMSAISKNDLEKIKIPLPPLEIQQKIANEVERRRQEAFGLQAEASKALQIAKDKFEILI